MIYRKPEGYKDLLAYKKSAELQEETLKLVALFPKSKTMIDLADQMARSARSGTKNIIEGWVRNTTKEYFTFLGFSIGSIEELKDDAMDISKGLYGDLARISGLWLGQKGEKGEKGAMGLGERGTTPTLRSGQVDEMGLGERGATPTLRSGQVDEMGLGERGVKGEKGVKGNNTNPLTPLTPFSPLQLEQLRFYPLDKTLPPVVQLYLRAKETLMLLNKLQLSLDQKMDVEGTKTMAEKMKANLDRIRREDKLLLDQIEKMGSVRLSNGQVVSKGSELHLEDQRRKGEK
jgi:four helix bundle protein